MFPNTEQVMKNRPILILNMFSRPESIRARKRLLKCDFTSLYEDNIRFFTENYQLILHFLQYLQYSRFLRFD